MTNRIPENEHEAVLQNFWQLLLSLEEKTDPAKDHTCKSYVEQGYTVVSRLTGVTQVPRWSETPPRLK